MTRLTFATTVHDLLVDEIDVCLYHRANLGAGGSF